MNPYPIPYTSMTLEELENCVDLSGNELAKVCLSIAREARADLEDAESRESEVDELQGQVDDLEHDKQELEDKVDELKKEVKQLQDEIEELRK